MPQQLALPESGWLSLQEISELGFPLATVQRWCKNKRFKEYQRLAIANGGKQYRVHIDSPFIPDKVLRKYMETRIPSSSTPDSASVVSEHDPETDMLLFSEARGWARDFAAKAFSYVDQSKGLRGNELRAWIAQWNDAHPDNTTSYTRLLAKRKDYAAAGLPGLLPGYGQRRGDTSVRAEWLAHFIDLMKKDGGTSIKSCWMQTLGKFCGTDPSITVGSFPGPGAFVSRMRNTTTGSSMYLARHGYKKWNRKHGYYIERDYSKVLAGTVWVADHAQIDVAVRWINPSGKEQTIFPWVTAWRDFKSGKWVGWDVFPDNPNSDHIFQAMHRGISAFGKPDKAYLDNGKDFRAKDFSGGRIRLRLDFDEEQARSLLGGLSIETIFAWPYNPQAKPIERDFLRNKEWFSKHAPGYRGGNVVERPETLNAEIAAGKILQIEEFIPLFDGFIREVTNRSIVSRGHRKGMCPDQIWDMEAPQAIAQGSLARVMPDALRMYCMRTSGDMSVQRGRARDSDLGISYTAEWMFGQEGRKIYMRRDSQAYQTSWCFDSVNNEYLGSAELAMACSAIADDDISREQLAKEIAFKRAIERSTRVMARTDMDTPFEEKIANSKRAVALLNKANGYEPATSVLSTNILATQLDRVAAQEKARERGDTTYVDLYDDVEIQAPEESVGDKYLIELGTEEIAAAG